MPNAFNVTPIIVYRVYADGRPPELVRGVDLIGTPLSAFGKIVATDNRTETFNGICGAESGPVPVSASSPALLVSEVEVQKKAKSQDTLPILPAPARKPVARGRSPGARGAEGRAGALDRRSQDVGRARALLHRLHGDRRDGDRRARDAGRAGREPDVAGARVSLRRARGRLRVRQLAVHRGRTRRGDGVDGAASRSTTTSWRCAGWRG